MAHETIFSWISTKNTITIIKQLYSKGNYYCVRCIGEACFFSSMMMGGDCLGCGSFTEVSNVRSYCSKFKAQNLTSFDAGREETGCLGLIVNLQ